MISHTYIILEQGCGGGGTGSAFPVPAPLILGDKKSSPSPNFVPHPRPVWGGSPRGPIPTGNVAIPR